ncbi:hypothetical protein PPTG_18335 [Phytophthora nicotianae INRA-310]|uniref:DUF7769 domain-containing protein n=1 Tax=Phytophthora nicotianae (strain INRA-310) TaxID=761204 RepID=W2PII8_PHYN3|nr:hypothetical protein PPTG_18335 [Phytophthora nicotianae INRA-310]ETN00064.1 hypothetical protein PPTG_18335 [Phytophthora nicotianae INRA-310]
MPTANLTDDERRQILDELLKQSVGGELPRGVQARVAREFRCSDASIGRIWHRFRETEANDGLEEWKSRIKQNSGRKKKNRDEIAAKIRAVPIEERKPYRPLAHAAGISKYLVQALIREGVLKVHSTHITPYLTENNKFRRIEHVLTYIDPTSLMFEPMYDVVHVDEKWFYEDVNKRSCLVFEDETPLQRSRRSKNHIPKTMFLAAVARPRLDPHCKKEWDGKVGL